MAISIKSSFNIICQCCKRIVDSIDKQKESKSSKGNSSKPEVFMISGAKVKLSGNNQRSRSLHRFNFLHVGWKSVTQKARRTHLFISYIWSIPNIGWTHKTLVQCMVFSSYTGQWSDCTLTISDIYMYIYKTVQTTQ